MKSSNFAASHVAVVHSEESIALRRRSSDSQGGDGDNLFDLSDILEFEQRENTVDGGREAWKTLFAAWLIDFMTSGEQYSSTVTQSRVINTF